MTTRDDIIQALASARGMDEQIKLVAELDALDDAARKTASAERSLNWADTTVRETMAPGRTLDRHTASSDWLAAASTDPGEDHHHAVIAEASVWYQRLDPDVRADAHEFVEQAKGIARRTAGKYGERAEEAADAFMQYVAFLNRQVLGASGLDQVQQRVDSFENPKETPLPTDVFDNFAPPIHPINQGVDGSQTNSLAPGAEEAMAENNGAPSGRPSEHEEGQDPVSEPYYPPASAKQGRKVAGMLENARHLAAQRGHSMTWEPLPQGQDAWSGRCTGCGSSMAVTASGIVNGSTAHVQACNHRTTAGLSQPSLAIGYQMNLDEFLRKQAERDDLSGWATAPDASGEPEAAEQNAGPDADYNEYLRSKQARKAGGAAPFVREAEHGGGYDPDHDGDDDSTPGGDIDHDFFTDEPNNPSRHASVRHTAPGGGEHAPYRIEQGDGGYYVVNDKGERKNSKPKSKAEARQFQKALYKNVPGARESAEADENKKEAASGLDQVQQVEDSFENPKPTSLPLDVMFPIEQAWPEEQAAYDKGGESQSGGGTGRPSTHNERAASRKTADMYGGGDSPHQVPGGETPVANSPATTPPNSNGGDFAKGVAQGQADAAAGERPSFADNSSKVSDFVRGYVQGYGTGQADTLPQDVPASMGGDSGQGRNFGETQGQSQPMLNMAHRKQAKDYSEEEREKLADEGEARPDGSFPIKTKKDLQNAKHDIGRSDDPAAAKRWINERAKEMGEPGVGGKKSMLTVSAAMVTKDVSGDADFVRGYSYGRAWKPGVQIVGMGSNGEEAGIYAGITDNPGAQKAWVAEHRKMAKAHPELEQRLRSHKLVTANFQARNEDAVVRGLYVQAATSLDLDTMSPTTSPSPQGATPSEGPGTVPILRDAPGSPAAPGGAAPYNGAEPFSQPVVPDPLMDPNDVQQPNSPDAVNLTGDSSLLSKNPQAMAFRRKVQASKLALRHKKEN